MRIYSMLIYGYGIFHLHECLLLIVNMSAAK